MVSSKLLLLIVAAATVSVGLGQLLRPSSSLNGAIAMILSIAAACIGSVSIVYLEKSKLAFSAYIHDRNFEGSELPALLGIHEFRVTNNYVSVRDKNGKFILHAYIRIRDIPFLIDDLDQGRKLLLVGNFVRLLGTLGFPFEIIPRIMPISSEAFLKSVGKKIEDQKLVASSEGNLVSPARKARLERLQRIYDRMAKGEKAKDVGFLAHVMVDGTDETKLVSELDTNVKTLISALESTLGIKAERLKGYEMYRTVTEFFRASSIVYPSRTFRVLTWDLAYLVPLTRPRLPPIEKMLNGVYIGRTYGGMPACLDLNSYSNPHGCCVGATGSGKSTFIKTFLTRCHDLEQIPILIIDYAGEYRDWIRSRKGTVIDMSVDTINPFELGSSTLADRIRQVVDSFDHNCDFKTINQRNAFAFYVTKAYREKGFNPTDKATWKCEPPTVQDIIRLMQQDFDHLKPMKQVTVLTLIDRLQAVASGAFGIFGKSTIAISSLTQGFTCVDLSKVTSTFLKDMIAWTVLQYIDSAMRVEGTQTKIRLVIALDEAWKLCRSESSLPVTIIKEGRKFGYSLWVASQDATADLAESILANAGTSVIFRTQYPKYLNYFKSAYALNEQEQSRVQNLSVGEALVKLSDDPRPFFVKVEMEEVEIGAEQSETPSKQDISDMTDQIRVHSEQTPNVLTPTFSDHDTHDTLDGIERGLLEIAAGSRIQTIRQLYDGMSVSDYQANKCKNSLIEKGLLSVITLPSLTGKGRNPQTLIPTEKGAEEAMKLGIKVTDLHKTRGIQHRFIVQSLEDQFRAHGWKTLTEYELAEEKRTDILLNDRVAIEVEMGKSEIVENVKKNAEVGFDVVVVSTQQAIASVRDKLNKAGLERTPVVLPNQVVALVKSNLAITEEATV